MGGSTFLTSASSCTSPKAPRERLSPSSSCRLTTLPVRLSIFFCASSMVAMLREPFVQVFQHLAVLLLEHRAEHDAGIPEIPFEQYQTAQHAQQDDQHDGGDRESDFNHGSL